MTITPESIAEGTEKNPKGSLLIFEADSLEEVKQIIERDIYFTEKVVGLFCYRSRNRLLTLWFT